MTLSEFCNVIYCKQKSKNQGAFMSALFFAAGSSYGSKPPKNNDYLGKIFRGAPLTASVKDSFAKPFHETELAAFFDRYIDDLTLPALTGFFQIPNMVQLNRPRFMLAVCRQFELFVAGDSENEVENIVAGEYSALFDAQTTAAQPAAIPLYANDFFRISKDTKTEYSVGCYEQIGHIFTIENLSRIVDWEGRYLEFDPASTNKIEPVELVASIPPTKRGAKATVAVQLAGKGFEGVFYPKWIMKDKKGNQCFQNKDIGITVNVDFKLNK